MCQLCYHVVMERHNISSLLTPALVFLRMEFVTRGFDLRLVGGCVRDFLYGTAPKDVDLCTDADPNEQISIYQDLGIRYIETGLQHGTVTVVLDGETYEITSLRMDTETDGRHAVVSYTKDWIKDLERRDFTINAMSMTFNGELVDPFNGLKDLSEGLVAFVGNAEERIREDYLRILRWFRFRGRYGMSMSYSARRAIERLADGLRHISRERVWMEISKIIAGNDGPYIMLEMHQMGVAEHAGLPKELDYIQHVQDVHAITRNPVTLMVSLYHNYAVDILTNWKASGDEIKLAKWLSEHRFFERSPFRYLALDRVSREWAIELAALRLMDGFDRGVLLEWEIPTFPVSGRDLINLGYAQDKSMGDTLLYLKVMWADSNYTMTKDELLDSPMYANPAVD